MNNNLPSITVGDFKSIVKAQFLEGNTRPIFGLGKGGIGKTESIEDLAKEELKVGYVDIRLLLYGETDLKGIPYPDQSKTKTVWLQNDILPTAERDGESGILVLDEITSANKSVRTAAYQLLNERKLGEYILPNGWLIVCLGNGEEDGGDFQGMEGNFANRCSVYNVVPSVEDWKLWAFSHNINSLVTSYVSFKVADLHSYNPDSETEMLFASPRSWAAVSDVINKVGYNKDDRITNLRIIANLGHRVGSQFLAFCKYSDVKLSVDDIISGKNVATQADQEIIYITIQSIVKIIGDSIKLDIENTGGVGADTIQKLANGCKWMFKLRKEYAVMGIADLIKYDTDNIRKLLLNQQLHQYCPELLTFVRENKHIYN